MLIVDSLYSLQSWFAIMPSVFSDVTLMCNHVLCCLLPRWPATKVKTTDVADESGSEDDAVSDPLSHALPDQKAG